MTTSSSSYSSPSSPASSYHALPGDSLVNNTALVVNNVPPASAGLHNFLVQTTIRWLSTPGDVVLKAPVSSNVCAGVFTRRRLEYEGTFPQLLVHPEMRFMLAHKPGQQFLLSVSPLTHRAGDHRYAEQAQLHPQASALFLFRLAHLRNRDDTESTAWPTQRWLFESIEVVGWFGSSCSTSLWNVLGDLVKEYTSASGRT